MAPANKSTGGEVGSSASIPTLRPAQGRCADAKKLRQKVLEILCGSSVPLSAYDILGRLQSEKRIAPTQVYRVLNALQENGVVHKLASRSAFVLRTSTPDITKVSVFMVCRECDRVQESAVSSLVQHLQVTAAKAGFCASNPIVEIEGKCADCAGERYAS